MMTAPPAMNTVCDWENLDFVKNCHLTEPCIQLPSRSSKENIL